MPLTTEAVTAICAHMNEDHADAVTGYARRFAGIADATFATLTGMDAAGMTLAVQTPAGPFDARIDFDHELADAEDARRTLIAMAADDPDGTAAHHDLTHDHAGPADHAEA